MTISVPSIQSVGDTYVLTWQVEGIQVKANRLVERAEGLSAELLITRGGGHLYQARVNLLSPTAKRTLASEMSSRINGLDWRIVVEQAFTKVLEEYRKGEPVVYVGNLPKRESPRYRLKPFILENEMSAIYAYGGSGKSVLSHLIAVLVQCGVSACGLVPIKGNVLILDWETSKETVDERVKAIKKGMNITSPELPAYRRCFHVLASDIYEIQEEVVKKDIQLIIVDSANMASGVTQDFHGPAQAMLAALRSLNRSVLIIDHKPKQGETMFGTVIKYNSMRSAWELESKQGEGSNLLYMAVKHVKHNDTRKFSPIGFEVEFNGNDDYTESIIFKWADPMQMQFFAEKQVLSKQIYEFLKSGAFSVAEIAKEFNVTEKIALQALKTGYFQRIGDKWGLKSHQTEEGSN